MWSGFATIIVHVQAGYRSDTASKYHHRPVPKMEKSKGRALGNQEYEIDMPTPKETKD